jgi:hypothetical protein
VLFRWGDSAFGSSLFSAAGKFGPWRRFAREPNEGGLINVPPTEHQFETLESAHDFVTLLAESVAEAKHELEADVQREPTSSRRLDALRIALYHLGKLEVHVTRTGRILNDLRSLRRLLFAERGRLSTRQTGDARQEIKPVKMPSVSDKLDPNAACQKLIAAHASWKGSFCV